jgi:hypothetical protein
VVSATVRSTSPGPRHGYRHLSVARPHGSRPATRLTVPGLAFRYASIKAIDSTLVAMCRWLALGFARAEMKEDVPIVSAPFE